jgi:hypothetical protein
VSAGRISRGRLPMKLTRVLILLIVVALLVFVCAQPTPGG